MKIHMTWKDPEWCTQAQEAMEESGVSVERADETLNDMEKAGLEEYLTLEYDTKTKKVTVLK